MRMATQNNVDVARLRHKLGVVKTNDVPPKMRQAYHDVAFLFLLEQPGHVVGGLHRVFILHSGTRFGQHQAVKFWRKAEHSDSQSVAPYHHIRLHQPLKSRSREVIIGADDGKLGLPEQPRHILHAEVELMIAYRSRVITHQIHQPHLDISSV